MAKSKKSSTPFNVVMIGQRGRLGYEAILNVASLRKSSPDFKGRVIVAEPYGENWWSEPQMTEDVKAILTDLGAEILPFETKVFGEHYPYGNKIEVLEHLPENEPFLFLDTDTLITGDLNSLQIDFDRPSASMRREGTWPVEELYWPGYTAIWKSLYDKFGLDFESSLDLSEPDEYWQRYMYFNAGWFFYKDPVAFGKRFREWAVEVQANPTPEMVIQPLNPWLDQVVLPLVIHSFGGGRPGPELDGLDGDVTCHYRVLPLLYAREKDEIIALLNAIVSPNKIKKVVKQYDPIKRMVLQGRGQKVRGLFDQDNLPRQEQKIRNRIKSARLWMR